MDLVLITSLAKTPNTPLSYSNIRSVFTHDERFEQTKRSIQSVREKIEGAKILLIECSDLSDEQRDYFKNNCDYFYNLYEREDRDDFSTKVNSKYKTLGELTLTTEAFKYIFENNIEFKNFYKLSGRYWINENFDINKFKNKKCHLNTDINCLNNIKYVSTCLYKLDYDYTVKWFNYLKDLFDLSQKNYSMENFLSFFTKDLYNDINCKDDFLLTP